MTAGDTGPQVLEHPALLIEDGVIAQITGRSAAPLPACDVHDDYPDATLCPAFFDVHIHGAMGCDVMEGTPAALTTVGQFLATRGVGAYFPTTVTASMDATLRALAGLSRIIAAPPEQAARPLGIHLEGPFLSHAKRGVHAPELLQKPSVALFMRFWEAAEGRIALMTIAPEVEGALELIAHASKLGVRMSLGHSNANRAEAEAGIAAGACSATHTFNAMHALDHRDPGIISTVFDTDSLYAELICDGIHVHPAMVRLFWKAKQQDRAMLITDGISATGMPNGEYLLGSMTVTVKDGVCLHRDAVAGDVLAGSVLTLDRAVQNFRAFTGASLADAVALVTANPARMAGLPAQGSLAMGGPAEVTVLGPDGVVQGVYLQGRRIDGNAG